MFREPGNGILVFYVLIFMGITMILGVKWHKLEAIKLETLCEGIWNYKL